MKSPSLLFTILVLSACGQADPAPDDPSTGGAGSIGGAGGAASGSGDGGPVANASGYFPLSVGSTWTYRHFEPAAGATWDEIVQTTAAEYGGRSTVNLQDNENLVGESGEGFHVREGGQVMRIHQEVSANGVLAYSVDYTPGFLRWDDAWAAATGTHDWQYTRVQTDAAGVQTSAVRTFSFTVLATSGQVDVPAGTFDCVHVERVRLDTQETKQYWFSDGVGKVRELNVGTGNTEELVAFQVQ